MAATYDIGDAPTVTATFSDEDGVLTNPTTVTAKLLAPDGTQTDLTPANTGTGIYRAAVPTLTQAGTHRVKFFGTGALVAAEEVAFVVRQTRFS